jgi:hypothetical protein
MGIKRVLGLVTTMVAAVVLSIGLSAVKPNVYFDMHRSAAVGHLIVASSANTSSLTPTVYFDM